MAETKIGLYKTEEIWKTGPWKSIEDVEFVTASWVEGFNSRRLLGPIGHLPPVEYEAMYDQETTAGAEVAAVN